MAGIWQLLEDCQSPEEEALDDDANPWLEDLGSCLSPLQTFRSESAKCQSTTTQKLWRRELFYVRLF